MDESKYEAAMTMILHAGNAKSSALLAIDAAAEGKFDEAKQEMKNAREEMREAHKIQFDMTQQEASGNSVEIHLILIHAEDHLTMAIMAADMAERMIELYERLRDQTLFKEIE